MANFNTHLSGGFLVSAVFALVGYKAGILNTQNLIICTALGTVGGLLPDIDSNNSTPLKIAFNASSLIAAFSLVIYWKNSLPLVQMISAWMAVFFIIRYLAFKVFIKITVHRGVIHSVPYMAMVALALVCISNYLFKAPAVASWLYGFYLFIGSLVHLILDEINSVDLMDRRLKRSFGTAFKIYRDKERLYFLLIYGIVGLLILYSPPFGEFWQILTDPVTWTMLSNAMV